MTVLPFLKRDIPVTKEQQQRNEEPKKRSIILPAYLWTMVEVDAHRCRRSINKHIEAIFAVYYGIESSVNINEESLAPTGGEVEGMPRLKKTA
jgi:hypothetical protein